MYPRCVMLLYLTKLVCMYLSESLQKLAEDR